MHARRTCQLWATWGILQCVLLAQNSAAQTAPNEGDEQTKSGPAWLSWHAPPECPSASYIEERIVEWLGRPPSVEARLAVDAAVLWRDDHWQVTAEISQARQKGERQVLVASCTEAADFVALSVVLALDPDSVAANPARLSEKDEETATIEDETAEKPSNERKAPDSREEPADSDTVATSPTQESVSFRPYLEASALLDVGIFLGPSGVLGQNWD